MCVILIADTARPTGGELTAAWTANPHGGGAAWIEGDRVHWRKGLSLGEMRRLAARLPMPYVLHFRWASVGAIVPALTHPFPYNGRLAMRGKTKQGVLFHNGTWTTWEPILGAMLRVEGLARPAGPWSDTRAMAWLVGQVGDEFLDRVVPEDLNRTVLFTPDGAVYRGRGWADLRTGLLASNTYFLRPKRQAPTLPRVADRQRWSDDFDFDAEAQAPLFREPAPEDLLDPFEDFDDVPARSIDWFGDAEV